MAEKKADKKAEAKVKKPAKVMGKNKNINSYELNNNLRAPFNVTIQTYR